MSDQEPNDKSGHIFARKGLATPSPETQEELDGLPPHFPSGMEDGSPIAGQPHAGDSSPRSSILGNSSLGDSGLDETAPAGSLLSVDLRQHTGRAWIEAQKSQSLTAEVSATLLLRQGNLPLDTPVSETPVPRDRARTWKQLREELESELTSASEPDETVVQPLPSWAEIKETLAKEIGSPHAQAEAAPDSESPSPLPPEVPDLLEPVLPLRESPDEAAAQGEVTQDEETQDEVTLEGGISDEAPEDEDLQDWIAHSEPELASPGEAADPSDLESFSEQAEPEPSEEVTERIELIAAAGLASEPMIENAGPSLDAAVPITDDLELPADSAAAPLTPDLSAEEPAHVLSGLPGERAWAKPLAPHSDSLDCDIPDAAGNESEEVAPIPPAQKPRQTAHIVGAALGFLATIVIGAGLWFQYGPGRESPTEVPLPEVTQSEQADTGTLASGPNQDAEPSADPGTTKPIETAETATPGETPEGADGPAIEPSFDLIRIEANGDAVIAGRAEPDTDLILLDKGKPIGATRSNADGEWAFIPDQPLPTGEHEFAMVVSTPQGEVLVPERPALESVGSNPTTEEGTPPAAEGTELRSAAQGGAQPEVPQASGGEKIIAGVDKEPQTVLLPTPKSKPETLLAQASPYGIQLSSNVSRVAAQKSWQGLQGRFPDLLGEKQLIIQEVTLDQGGTRFRVQTGFFENLGAARKLCRAFTQRRQDCLVFRR